MGDRNSKGSDPKEPDPKVHDPKAVNPFYRGARFSEVARAVASPTDPEVRERIRLAREAAERERRGSGPRPDHTPAPGR